MPGYNLIPTMAILIKEVKYTKTFRQVFYHGKPSNLIFSPVSNFQTDNDNDRVAAEM